MEEDNYYKNREEDLYYLNFNKRISKIRKIRETNISLKNKELKENNKENLVKLILEKKSNKLTLNF